MQTKAKEVIPLATYSTTASTTPTATSTTTTITTTTTTTTAELKSNNLCSNSKTREVHCLANKLQDFNAFKHAFLQYFSNNNSINQLANTFTTIKQGETEAVTTYLGCFHKNLHQIQVIDTNYFIVAQILNQFIYGLHSSILQYIRPMHLINLQAAITNTRDFKAIELEANHAQTNESLDIIFPFELEELLTMLLFSEAALKEKPITVIYTDAKVDGHSIKLILDSGSADSIITRQLMDQLGHQVDCTASAKIITANGVTKTPIGEIDNFSIEVNNIIVSIKVLVMEATQYQALIGNNWLSKTHALLDWNMQELQISQNGQHTCVPAMCGHFKTTKSTIPLIKFKKKEKKPIWEAYQVSWAEKNHNKLLPILS
ncbi:hypothetical protein G9A89_022830 [Geosiphon pyriformis]|nr:hypothetical protein G9A89_022830 [Geosiphon pyriformis]